MAMAARSSSSVGRRRGRPLWWRSGLERVALLSMLCLAVTAAISVVRAADDMPPEGAYALEQQFFVQDDGFVDRYNRWYSATAGGNVSYHGRAVNLNGQVVSDDDGEVLGDEVVVPADPNLAKDENDSGSKGEDFMPQEVPASTPAAAATVNVIDDPCEVDTKWKRNHIQFGPDMSGTNINTFVGEVVKAVRKARTWRSRIPFTKAWKQRKSGCTAENAEAKITQLSNPEVGSDEEPDAITGQRLALLNTLRSSLEYRLSRFLSPGKRARCLFRFGKGLVLRWSWRCNKSSAFWKTLKEVSMCVGDRWKLCYEYGSSMTATV